MAGTLLLRERPARTIIDEHSSGTKRAAGSYSDEQDRPGPCLERDKMLALRSLVAVCAVAVLSHQAFAANDTGGYAAPDAVQQGLQGNAQMPSGPGNAGNPANTAKCAKTKSPEQRAQRKALKEQQVAQGVQQKQPNSAGHKARVQ